MISVNKINRIFEITGELSHIKNQSLLLEKSLKELMEVIKVDACSVYLVKNKELVFELSRNNTLQKDLPFGKRFIAKKEIIPMDNKSIAGYVATSGLLVNIEDVYLLNSQPYSFDKSFDRKSGYRTRSMLALPIRSYERGIIGVLQLINALDREGNCRAFVQEDEEVATLFIQSLAPALYYTQIIKDMGFVICNLIHQYNPRETYGHACRVANIAGEIYKSWAYKQGVPNYTTCEKQDKIMTVALFHDINLLAGKSETREGLLQTILNINAILVGERNIFLEDLKDLVLNYREFWNGEGFPGHIDYFTGEPLLGYDRGGGVAFGKREREIPLTSRILAVAHRYDYMMHKLNDLGKEEVIEKSTRREVVKQMMQLSGTVLDPAVLSAFAGCLDNLETISEWVI